MGTITKRVGKTGTSYQVKIRTKNGPPLSRTFSSKSAALGWMVDQERELESGERAASSISLRAHLDALIEASSKKDQQSVLRIISKHRNAQLSISKFRAFHAQEMVEDWLADEIKPATCRRRIVALSGLFAKATKLSLIKANPLTKFDMPDESPGRDRRVTRDEIVLLIAATDSLALAHVVVVAVETAMRRGELAGLTWDRVNLDARIIRLRSEDTKTKSGRVVGLSTTAVECLRLLGPGADGASVFGLQPDSISQAFTRAAERAALPDLVFHDLRHEAVSRMFERGISATRIRGQTGHKTARMLDRYTHLEPLDIVALLG